MVQQQKNMQSAQGGQRTSTDKQSNPRDVSEKTQATPKADRDQMESQQNQPGQRSGQFNKDTGTPQKSGSRSSVKTDEVDDL